MLNFISVRPDILSGIRLFLYPRLPCPIYRVHFPYENDRDGTKKGSLSTSLGCPVGFFRLRSSDFVDYEPGSHPTGHKKKEVFRLPFQGAQSDSNRRHSEPQSDALTN